MHEVPATIIHTRTVYTGRVFSAQRDRVSLPNGREAVMDVVRHGPSVILVPLIDPDHVVLVRQYRYVIDRWIWELPAGSVDPGEDLESAARRECHEEIGRVPERVERIGEYYPTPGYSDELMVFFRLTQLTVPETRAAADADEILEPRIFSLAEARSLIAGSDTQDMKTVLGLTLV